MCDHSASLRAKRANAARRKRECVKNQLTKCKDCVYELVTHLPPEITANALEAIVQLVYNLPSMKSTDHRLLSDRIQEYSNSEKVIQSLDVPCSENALEFIKNTKF
jgi:hypothetical protein